MYSIQSTYNVQYLNKPDAKLDYQLVSVFFDRSDQAVVPDRQVVTKTFLVIQSSYKDGVSGYSLES